MEDSIVSYNAYATISDTATSPNATQLQEYRIWNEYLPDFLVHTIPIAYFSFGTTLNIILFIYITGSGRWKSPIFTVIGSLAIADTMVCFAGVLWAAFVFPVITYKKLAWFCHMSIFLGFGGMSTGGYTLIFFAALRFYQLTYPLAARARVTCSFVLKWLTLVWTVNLNYCGVLYGILYRPKEVLINREVELVCEQIGNAHAANIGHLILSTITPSISIAVLHIAKYFAVARSRKDLEVQHEKRNTDARAVSIVILMFIICWFPVNTYSVSMGGVSPDYRMFQDNLYLIFISITCCNSTFNPIIYCIAAKTVRDDLIRFLCCRKMNTNKT